MPARAYQSTQGCERKLLAGCGSAAYTTPLASTASTRPTPCRAALCSCCAAIWAQPGVACNPALWGDALRDEHFLLLAAGLARQPPAKQLSLWAWLGRRAEGLRRLRLDFGGHCPEPEELFAGLLGSPVEELHLLDLPLQVGY